MKVDIRVFHALDDIAKTNNVSDADWAKASGMNRARLFELRKIYASLDNQDKYAYKFTISRLISLYRGLYRCIGGSKLNEHLLTFLKNEPDVDVRLTFLILLHYDTNLKSKLDMEKYLTDSLTPKLNVVNRKG